jgi:hypothetical protein
MHAVRKKWLYVLLAASIASLAIDIWLAATYPFYRDQVTYKRIGATIIFCGGLMAASLKQWDEK